MPKPSVAETVRAMQLDATRQTLELSALRKTLGSIRDNLEAQVRDAETTAQNHVDALQHIIDELEAREPSGE